MSLPVTEDTPPDMLAGAMDLKVILPNGRKVKMSIQRSTPMMDLLVQATTAHCLNPGDHSLQAMGDKGVLPFKPSTPIGALDTFTVKIVEKKLNSRGRAPQVPQSFLNTFRLQVHLPRSQLFVVRVTPDVTLSEIMTHICTEKNLNINKYEFKNPGNLEETLDLDKTLGDYKLQELSMVSKNSRPITGLMSSVDIINVKSSKHRQNSVCDSSLSSGSFGSRSGSPLPTNNVMTMPPQPPIRKKRRPAPKPPTSTENEKKDQKTGSVLISHSRESSDSSGYHEASVLSESPTHGRTDDSPPDTLPRRSKLPPSQSFTNLTSIQPRGRLSNSVSNTSLNSNGQYRKKRAPPPPPTSTVREDKVKSSTLPAEGRRIGSSFTAENAFIHSKVDAPVETAVDTKVQSPVVNETKASSDEAPASVDVDVKLPPKPKPRTLLPSSGTTFRRSPKTKNEKNLVSLDVERESKDSFQSVAPGSLNRWNNVENLSEEDGDVSVKPKSGDEPSPSQTIAQLDASMGIHEVSSSLEHEEDQIDHDSINWEYQLPPPPTDFQDRSSPNCTVFGTITITPEILENVDKFNKDPDEGFPKKSELINSQMNCNNEISRGERNESQNNYIYRMCSDKNYRQSKSEVMNELTNILNGSRKCREKSLSVSNLYINESKDLKTYALNYSRSFRTEPASTLDNFKITTYQNNNKMLSNDNEAVYNNEITNRNYKNLEKSSSMECIHKNSMDSHSKIIEKTEDVFRKPIAPVQKKLKVAKRSASSIGVNTANPQKMNSLDTRQNNDPLFDEANIEILRQQFVEFLNRKKENNMLNTDLNMKSLDVIRNILPELNLDKEERNCSRCHVNVTNVNPKKETNSQEIAQLESESKQNGRESEQVKIVDVKVKSPPEESPSDEVTLRHNSRREVKEESTKRGTMVDSSPAKNPEVGKRYSYQGPPSINFATWGERPKTTRIIIKDEDYVTQEKVTEKKTEMVQCAINRNENIIKSQAPKEVKKPAQIVIKKPGVLSHYEMFSALPRRKEVSSLELVQMEDEEKKEIVRNESKKFNKVPVVCGVELKKEFRHSTPARAPSFSSPKSNFEPETNKPKHSVSVYVNGNESSLEKNKVAPKQSYSFILPKRNNSVMPVVKGFRPFEDNSTTSHVNISNSCASSYNNTYGKKDTVSESNVAMGNKFSPSSRQSNGVIPTPPPAPPNNNRFVKLNPVSSSVSTKPKTISQDPRGQLLEEIRNFGGLKKLKKSPAY